MSTLAWVAAGAAGATAALTVLILVVARRRATPFLKLEPDLFPPVTEASLTFAGLTESAVYEGNRATVLQNGALYPAMLDDIRAAKETVHLETFVWSKGVLERQFVDVLSAKAREGLKVRVLIDNVGASKASRDQLDRLQQSGAQLTSYCRPHWWNWDRFNHRTHRKLLIVDGHIGYTFGHGVADEWLGNGEDAAHWRDTAIRLEGPVVHALQSVFAQNWVEETKALIVGPGCFPRLERRGTAPAHVVSSATGDAVSSVATLYTIAIAAARHEVLIQNPYFVPDDGVIQLFAMMVRRGVEVHLMLPGKHTDNPFVRRAGCHLYEGLLRAGVHLYEFEPTLLHQKIVVVDELWSHVGSSNFDARSLALNEEVGIGIVDREIALELKKAFAEDLRRSSELSLEKWRGRTWRNRAFDRMAYLLHAQL